MDIDKIKSNYIRELELVRDTHYSDQHWKILMDEKNNNILNIDALNNFRRNEISFGLDNSNPSDYVEKIYINNTVSLFKKLKEHIQPDILKFINEIDIGNPRVVVYDKYQFSRSSIEYAFILSHLHDYLEGKKYVIEIGGGYGGLARMI